MTPTEQDNELFRLASLIGCEPQDEERHRQQLADYITADMKRVAIEARLDELENNKWLPNEAKWIEQEADRIAELRTTITGKEGGDE